MQSFFKRYRLAPLGIIRVFQYSSAILIYFRLAGRLRWILILLNRHDLPRQFFLLSPLQQILDRGSLLLYLRSSTCRELFLGLQSFQCGILGILAMKIVHIQQGHLNWHIDFLVKPFLGISAPTCLRIPLFGHETVAVFVNFWRIHNAILFFMFFALCLNDLASVLFKVSGISRST